jgi:hypothetical protein
MIKLTFITGGALRKVTIDGKNLTMITQETGFAPIVFDLNRIEENKMFNKLNKDEKKLLKDIQKLDSEEEIAKDITKDFQRSGWRLSSKHGFK